MNILMIIDMQKGFITDNNKHIVDVINNIVKSNKFDKIIATKFINKENSPFIKFLNWEGMLEPEEQKIIVDLPKDTVIIEKTSYMLPSYIVASHKLYLEGEIIHLKDDDNVFICGTDQDACILGIAYQLFDSGIRVKFIKNAISSASKNSVDLEILKNIYKRNFGKDSIVDNI